MKVYILLTDTGTLLNRMVKMYTKQPLNHASISFDQSLREVYSFGRKKPNNPFIGGFVKENMQCKLFRRAKCAVYSCSVTEAAFDEMKKFVHTIEVNKEDYKYNFIGLFGVMLNTEVKRNNAFFCSQFVATILHGAGITIVDKPEIFITPKDIKDCQRFHLVYEGCLGSYPLQSGEDDCVSEGRFPLLNRFRLFFAKEEKMIKDFVRKFEGKAV